MQCNAPPSALSYLARSEVQPNTLTGEKPENPTTVSRVAFLSPHQGQDRSIGPGRAGPVVVCND